MPVGHDTPFNVVNRAPAWLGLVTGDQLVPFQLSTREAITDEVLAKEPTAKQLVVVGHDTPLKVLSAPPAGLGLATIDHVVPFQSSTSELLAKKLLRDEPTAKQLVVLVHDTPLNAENTAPVGLGLMTRAQVVPFQRSTNDLTTVELLTKEPTAKQLVAVGHETPLKLVVPEGLGLATIDQVVLFHCSASDFWVVPLEEEPTAKQLVVVGHDTPFKTVEVDPARLGLATIDHVVLIHCSTNDFWVVPLEEEPTAKQLVVVGHDTPFKTVEADPAGLGLATIDQVVPFQCSASDFSAAPSKNEPTAKQLAVLGHDTAARWLCELVVGGAATDHATPSQRSTMAPPPSPAAKHLVVLAHDTPFNVVNGVPVGLVTIDQVVPFHCSTRESYRESPE